MKQQIITVIVTTLTTLGIVFALGIGPGQEEIPIAIKAHSFHVVDENGNTRVFLATTKDSKGRAGIVTVTNSNGQPVAAIGVSRDRDGLISIFDQKGRKMVIIAATTDGNGFVTTMNRKGEKLVTLEMTDNGEGTLLIRDGNGRLLVGLGATSDGTGVVGTFDPKGQHRPGKLMTIPK